MKKMVNLHGTEISSSYIIATSPRTGSYLLSEYLTNTALVGTIFEPFDPVNREDLGLLWGLPADSTFMEYVQEIVRQSTTSNGVFGIKLHWDQIEWTRSQLDIGTPEDQKIIDHLFPHTQKFIHLIRKDLRAQAISAYRAYYTQEWWKKRDVYNTQPLRPDPPYRSARIRYWENRLAAQNDSWDKYFAHRGITPLRVYYEDLDKEYRPVITCCLEYLSVSDSRVIIDSLPKPTFLRQADAVSRAWHRRLDEEDAKE